MVGVGAVFLAFLLFLRGVLTNGGNLSNINFSGLLFTVTILSD